MLSEGYTPSWYQIEEERYFYNLMRYLNKDEKNNELGFLNNELEKFNKVLDDAIKNNVKGSTSNKEHGIRNTKIKIGFYELKLSRLLSSKKQKQQSKSLMLDGKLLNLKERFKIADEILNISEKIRELNISDMEKYKLISIIFGCNETNARQIINGSYNANVREELINDYLQTLNK